MHTLTEMVESRAGLNPDVMALMDDGGHRLTFSSGTTGLPKAIPMRHRSLVRSSLVDSLGMEGMYVGAPHLAPAPLFHLAGLVNLLMGMTHGASVHVRAAFSPDDMLDTVERSMRCRHGLAIDCPATSFPAHLRSSPCCRATPPARSSSVSFGRPTGPARTVRSEPPPAVVHRLGRGMVDPCPSRLSC